MTDLTDKNPDSLQDEVKDIYNNIQRARNEVAKLDKAVAAFKKTILEYLDAARDQTCNMGGKVK